MKKYKPEWQDLLQDKSKLLFYGELEFFLDKYIKKFFTVDIPEVGFNDSHPMNNLEFWYTVSFLDSVGFVDYGTSPRGAWLTEEGELFKQYCLENESPISEMLKMKI